MINTDKYLLKIFDIENYNCWDFIRDIWLELTRVDIGKRTPVNISKRSIKENFETGELEFKKISSPVSPCIVLFKNDKLTPHVGVFLNNKVLHLKNNGPRYEDLTIASIGFNNIGFYLCKEH